MLKIIRYWFLRGLIRCRLYVFIKNIKNKRETKTYVQK